MSVIGQFPLFSASGGGVEIVSYAGTDAYGLNNPSSVTFSIVPKVVFFLGYYEEASKTAFYPVNAIITNMVSDIMLPDVLTTEFQEFRGFAVGANNNRYYGKKSPDGKSFFWYSTVVGRAQLNGVGHTYYFMAIA